MKLRIYELRIDFWVYFDPKCIQIFPKEDFSKVEMSQKQKKIVLEKYAEKLYGYYGNILDARVTELLFSE